MQCDLIEKHQPRAFWRWNTLKTSYQWLGKAFGAALGVRVIEEPYPFPKLKTGSSGPYIGNGDLIWDKSETPTRGCFTFCGQPFTSGLEETMLCRHMVVLEAQRRLGEAKHPEISTKTSRNALFSWDNAPTLAKMELFTTYGSIAIRVYAPCAYQIDANQFGEFVFDRLTELIPFGSQCQIAAIGWHRTVFTYKDKGTHFTVGMWDPNFAGDYKKVRLYAKEDAKRLTLPPFFQQDDYAFMTQDRDFHAFYSLADGWPDASFAGKTMRKVVDYRDQTVWYEARKQFLARYEERWV